MGKSPRLWWIVGVVGTVMVGTLGGLDLLSAEAFQAATIGVVLLSVFLMIWTDPEVKAQKKGDLDGGEAGRHARGAGG